MIHYIKNIERLTKAFAVGTSTIYGVVTSCKETRFGVRVNFKEEADTFVFGIDGWDNIVEM